MSLKPQKRFFEQLKSQSYDWVLLAIVAVLCIGGLAFLASALSSRGAEAYQREFLHQLIFGLWIGGVLAFILARLDYHVLLKYRNYILVTCLGLLAFLAFFVMLANLMGTTNSKISADIRNNFAFVPIKPFTANGSMRWIDTPLSNFQPSELAKAGLLIYFASFLLQNQKEGITWLNMKKPFYAFLLAAVLIIVQPDLGSILLTFGILMSALWVAKIPVRMILIMCAVLLPIGVFFAFSGYRTSRIEAIYNPQSEAAYHINQIRRAISSGGMWGQGYGNSLYKQNDQIPEHTTDAILGVIAEEMGFVFTVSFLSLYLFLFYRGIKIANEAPDIGGKALATGISVWLVSQAFFNVTGVTGLTPLKGLPLPFVSEGGSALVTNLAIVGILMNISSQAQKSPAYNPNPAFVSSKPRVAFQRK